MQSIPRRTFMRQVVAAGSALGGCPIFAGKQVAATGSCSAWVKKAWCAGPVGADPLTCATTGAA